MRAWISISCDKQPVILDIAFVNEDVFSKQGYSVFKFTEIVMAEEEESRHKSKKHKRERDRDRDDDKDQAERDKKRSKGERSSKGDVAKKDGSTLRKSDGIAAGTSQAVEPPRESAEAREDANGEISMSIEETNRCVQSSLIDVQASKKGLGMDPSA